LNGQLARRRLWPLLGAALALASSACSGGAGKTSIVDAAPVDDAVPVPGDPAGEVTPDAAGVADVAASSAGADGGPGDGADDAAADVSADVAPDSVSPDGAPDSTSSHAASDASPPAVPGCNGVQAICNTNCWCWENPLPQGNGLQRVWGSDASHVWAVG